MPLRGNPVQNSITSDMCIVSFGHDSFIYKFIFLKYANKGSFCSRKKNVRVAVCGSCRLGELRCGGVAVWGNCSVGKLQCKGVVVWESCCVGELRCGGIAV